MMLWEDIERISDDRTRYWFEHELDLIDTLSNIHNGEPMLLSLLLYLCYDEYIPPKYFDVALYGGKSDKDFFGIRINDRIIKRIELVSKRVPEECSTEYRIKVIFS